MTIKWNLDALYLAISGNNDYADFLTEYNSDDVSDLHAMRYAWISLQMQLGKCPAEQLYI